MFELRQILERAVLDKVGHSSNPKAAIAPLMELVKQERQAFVTHDRPRWIRLSAEFHVALAEQSGNPLVVEMMRRLVSRTTLMIASVEAPGNNACSFDEHLDILNALERGDASAAQAHMAQHLQCCADRVRPEAPADFDLRSVLGPRGGRTKSRTGLAVSGEPARQRPAATSRTPSGLPPKGDLYGKQHHRRPHGGSDQ